MKDLEVLFSYPYQHEESWPTYKGEKTLEPEIEEFLASMSRDLDLLCIQKIDEITSGEIYGMPTKEEK